MSSQKNLKKKWWIAIAVVIVLGGGGFYYVQSQAETEDEDEPSQVTAERGTIVEKALAVGAIEPENEIEIKSKISGVATRLHAEAGDYVKKGDPLIEVSPDPTPLELAEANRNLERTKIEKENLEKELKRMESLREQDLVSEKDYDDLLQQVNDVKVRVQMDEERLELLESGRVQIGETLVESVIRAPIDGYILEELIDIGEPVVPLTSYQEGTPLMSIAAMENLLFKGTVDEIDIGKVEEGMPVEIKIGALPGDTVRGEVSRISLKAIEEENATVFPIEIAITETNGAVLRAGYSANADIIIEKLENALTIPERVIETREGRHYVDIPGDEPGSRKEKEIKLGLSDAVTVSVMEGLSEGDTVLERPVRELTVR